MSPPKRYKHQRKVHRSRATSEGKIMQLYRAPCLEGPIFGLMLCCSHPKILNTFWKGVLHFHFTLGPANSVASPAQKGN